MAAVALMMIIIQILCAYIPATAVTMISANFDEDKDEMKQISTLSNQFIGKRAKTAAAAIDKLVEIPEEYLVILEQLESAMKKIDGS